MCRNADIIFTAHWLSYPDYARRGCFFPISGLVDRYAPKTKAELGSTVLEAAKVDGELFALPVPGRLYTSAGRIVFRKDIVEKYNIDLSRIRRLEDVEPILKLVKQKQPDLVPMVLDIANRPIYDLIGFEQAGSDNLIPGVLSNDPKDNRIYNEYESGSLKAYLKTLNRFHKAGYTERATNVDTGRAFCILRSNADTSYGSYKSGSHTWVSVSLGKPVITRESATNSMYSVWYNTIGGWPLTLKYPPAFSGEVPMAPMKQLFDSLDAISGYDPASGKITARKYDKLLELTLGETSGFLNGDGVKLDAPPSLINGQVYVPAESVCTLLGYGCKWNAGTRTLQITGTADAAGIT